jgi:outer membrane protein OmpA-like peptidoglycan-associated protein
VPASTHASVGHTDNVGGYDYNVGLSQRRATAVVQELAGKHGVPAARLKPAGTGPLAPVAPNDTDVGRAKNRRVELVKQCPGTHGPSRHALTERRAARAPHLPAR